MDVLIGFAVGYYLGAKGGSAQLEQLGEAARSIAASPEFQGVMALATSFLQRAGEAEGGLAGLDVGALVGDQIKQMVEAVMTRAA